ncbi:MAG: SRPBCC family protein [Lachnospiraceae bacterium]|nr:SRPBCC family protein [Lachnospiraceae bacterium]
MDVNVSVRINASPKDAWTVFKNPENWQEWYGLPVTEADWRSGGHLSYAARDGIAAGNVVLSNYTEGQAVTFSGPWADEVWAVQPDSGGCVFSKRITPKNGANFTADGYPRECAKQQAYLNAFKTVVERSFPQAAAAPTSAAPAASAPLPESMALGSAASSAPKKKKSKAPLFIILGAAVLTLGLAAASPFILRPFLQERQRTLRYNEGAAAIEDGDYEKALDIFTELGDYDDSASLAAYAKRGVGYQEAKKLMNREEYAEAAKAFEALNGFKDSDALAQECRTAAAYEEGTKLFAEGDYEAAIAKFTEAGDYEDAADKTAEAEAALTELKNAAAYEEAIALFESGDYEAAARAFTALYGYKDAWQYLERCEDAILTQQIQEAIAAEDYEEAQRLLDTSRGKNLEGYEDYLQECWLGRGYQRAVEAFNDELYYTAYEQFLSLGGYRDAADRAEDCIQPTPSTGEIFHDSGYASSALRLTIDPNRSDSSDTYFKIYAVSGSEEILVSCVYIRSGNTAAVWLPSGTYVLKTASGSGSWFGMKEMFGDDGYYARLQNGGAGDRFTLEQNGDYILTLQNAENGNVGSHSEDREDF